VCLLDIIYGSIDVNSEFWRVRHFLSLQRRRRVRDFSMLETASSQHAEHASMKLWQTDPHMVLSVQSLHGLMLPQPTRRPLSGKSGNIREYGNCWLNVSGFCHKSKQGLGTGEAISLADASVPCRVILKNMYTVNHKKRDILFFTIMSRFFMVHCVYFTRIKFSQFEQKLGN